MSNIKHSPILDVDQVIEHYTKKDEVPIKYVCTSALDASARAYDIFFRETPHPEFGNRYFGLCLGPSTRIVKDRDVFITNADGVEKLQFDCIEGPDGWEYSQHRWDYRQVGNNAIDGGRSYLKVCFSDSPPVVKTFKVKDGEFIE